MKTGLKTDRVLLRGMCASPQEIRIMLTDVLILIILQIALYIILYICCCLVSHSVLSDSLQPHESQDARPPWSITNSRSLLRLTSIESVMPSNRLILCCPLLLLPSIFPPIRVFSSESVLHIRWPKYWSFSFSINSSSEYSGLMSFRMDWLDLFAVQGILRSLHEQHN